PPSFPAVTLLIAAHNEELFIAQKLDNSLALDYPRDRLQILVAADGSDDQTPEIVRGYGEQGVELSFIPKRSGKMAAINRAMPQARGDIVVFSDANNMYNPQAIRELVIPFTDPTVGAAIGAKLVTQDKSNLSASEGLYWKYESSINENETRLGCCTSAVGEILAIRRELFIPPPDKIINDDHYMVLDLIRRGYRAVYVPTARSSESISASARDEIIRRSRMNVGHYQLMAQARKILSFRRPMVAWQIVSHK
ncbi:unnamed protein product, partial [marine sediment metagenome]